MFDISRVLLEQYYCAVIKKGMTARTPHLLHEIRGRLRGLQWCYSRLVELDKQLDAEGRASIGPGMPTPDILKRVFADTGEPECINYTQARVAPAADDEVRLLLEAFYYSAHRIRNILQDGKSDLPKVTGFESKGVRNVRNHLVEHPDGKNGILVSSIATGGPVGPQLKPLRWSLEPEGTVDEGLHMNAADFERDFDRVVTNAINSLTR